MAFSATALLLDVGTNQNTALFFVLRMLLVTIPMEILKIRMRERQKGSTKQWDSRTALHVAHGTREGPRNDRLIQGSRGLPVARHSLWCDLPPVHATYIHEPLCSQTGRLFGRRIFR